MFPLFYKEGVGVSILLALHPLIIMAFYLWAHSTPTNMPLMAENQSHIESRVPASE